MDAVQAYIESLEKEKRECSDRSSKDDSLIASLKLYLGNLTDKIKEETLGDKWANS